MIKDVRSKEEYRNMYEESEEQIEKGIFEVRIKNSKECHIKKLFSY